MVITGSIFITSNLEIVNESPLDGITKIVSLDEDGSFNHEMNPNAIGGHCLLPPMEAKIAEADGDEVTYDRIYSRYLFQNYQQRFMAVLVAYMARGGRIIIYLPEDGTNTKKKLCQFILMDYGIKIGDIDYPPEDNCAFNIAFTPCWLNIMYKSDLISWHDYLLNMPAEARLDVDPVILPKLSDEMSPFASNRAEQYRYIIDFHRKLHQNPNLKQAIRIDFGGNI